MDLCNESAFSAYTCDGPIFGLNVNSAVDFSKSLLYRFSVQRFDLLMNFIHYFWIAPLQVNAIYLPPFDEFLK